MKIQKKKSRWNLILRIQRDDDDVIFAEVNNLYFIYVQECLGRFTGKNLKNNIKIKNIRNKYLNSRYDLNFSKKYLCNLTLKCIKVLLIDEMMLEQCHSW